MGWSVALVVVAAAIVAYTVATLVATRKVAAGRGRWVWVQRSVQLLIPVVFIWAGVDMLASAPAIGLIMAALGVGWLAVIVRTLRQMSRRVSAATSTDEIGNALTEPLVDQYVIFIGVTLIGGLIVVVALIVYGVMLAAR